jgi:hypothetical protein
MTACRKGHKLDPGHLFPPPLGAWLSGGWVGPEALASCSQLHYLKLNSKLLSKGRSKWPPSQGDEEWTRPGV